MNGDICQHMGLSWVVGALAALVALALVARWLERNPRGDAVTGLALTGMILYSRLVHRMRVRGREHTPPRTGHGPMIIVANHTSGADPLLIQSAARTVEVRFMMAKDMQMPALQGLWDWLGVIGVSRTAPDSRAAREAIRYLQTGGKDGRGGVIGIFPEGGIERPARQVLPFAPGIGLLVAKTGARVLPVVIEGTPYTRTAWGSFVRRGRATLTFLAPVEYGKSGLKPAEIAADLRRRFLEHTGWARNDDPSLEAIRA